MDGEDKKFQTPEIVILLMLAGANDGLEIIGDLSLAIPVIGEMALVFIEVINLFIWAIILFWFIMKLGFGGPALLQTAGGIAEMAGIPARTLTVIGGIFMANNPKAAEVAALATTGGAGASVAKEAAAAEKTAVSAGEAGAASATEGVAAKEATGVKKEVSPQALGEEKSPFEKLQELTEKTPKTEQAQPGGNIVINDADNIVDLRQ